MDKCCGMDSDVMDNFFMSILTRKNYRIFKEKYGDDVFMKEIIFRKYHQLGRRKDKINKFFTLLINGKFDKFDKLRELEKELEELHREKMKSMRRMEMGYLLKINIDEFKDEEDKVYFKRNFGSNVVKINKIENKMEGDGNDE